MTSDRTFINQHLSIRTQKFNEHLLVYYRLVHKGWPYNKLKDQKEPGKNNYLLGNYVHKIRTIYTSNCFSLKKWIIYVWNCFSLVKQYLSIGVHLRCSSFLPSWESLLWNLCVSVDCFYFKVGVMVFKSTIIHTNCLVKAGSLLVHQQQGTTQLYSNWKVVYFVKILNK